MNARIFGALQAKRRFDEPDRQGSAERKIASPQAENLIERVADETDCEPRWEGVEKSIHAVNILRGFLDEDSLAARRQPRTEGRWQPGSNIIVRLQADEKIFRTDAVVRCVLV
jgi:hypothetical protein